MSSITIIAILSGMSYAVAGLGYKMAEYWQCQTPVFILIFAMTGCVFTGINALFETTAWLDPKLWLLGCMMGLLFDLAIYFIMQANRLGPASASWTVLNLGLLVPIFVSPVIMDEAMLWVDPVIVILFILMLLLFARGMKDTGDVVKGAQQRHLLMLAGIFFSQGFFLLGNKIKYALFHDANTSGLAFIVYLSGGALVLFQTYRSKKQLRVTIKALQAGTITGVFNGLGTILLLSAMRLPSAIVFSLSASIALLGGVFLTGYIYGERLNRLKVSGVIFGLMALILAVFREHLVT